MQEGEGLAGAFLLFLDFPLAFNLWCLFLGLGVVVRGGGVMVDRCQLFYLSLSLSLSLSIFALFPFFQFLFCSPTTIVAFNTQFSILENLLLGFNFFFFAFFIWVCDNVVVQAKEDQNAKGNRFLIVLRCLGVLV